MSIRSKIPGEVGFRPGYIKGPGGFLRFATDEERQLLTDIERLKLTVAVACVAALLMAGAYIGTLAGVLLP